MMIGNIFGSDGLIVVMIAVVVLFGGSQLPKLAKNVGAAGHEFRKAQREAEAEHESTAVELAPIAVVPAVSASPSAASTGVGTPTAAESALLSRSDLRQELARLLAERDQPAAG